MIGSSKERRAADKLVRDVSQSDCSETHELVMAWSEYLDGDGSIDDLHVAIEEAVARIRELEASVAKRQ